MLVEVTSEGRRRDGLAVGDVKVGRGQQQYSTRQTDRERGEDLDESPRLEFVAETHLPNGCSLSAHDGEANAAFAEWSLARWARLCMQFRLPTCICKVMRGDLRARRSCFLVCVRVCSCCEGIDMLGLE